MSRADDDLRGLVGYNIQRASSAIMGAVNRVLTPFGLRRASYSVLSVVVGTPGLRQADISDALAIERPNLVRIVEGLERAGWIERRQVAGDRRAFGLHPTAEGRAHYAKARAALSAFDARLTETLGPTGRATLIAGLNTVENAETEAADGAHTP